MMSVLIIENLDFLYNAAKNGINIGSCGRIQSQGSERGAFRIEKICAGERKTLGQIYVCKRSATHKYTVTDRGRIFGESESGNACAIAERIVSDGFHVCAAGDAGKR